MAKKTKTHKSSFPILEQMSQEPLMIGPESMPFFATCIESLCEDKQMQSALTEVVAPTMSSDDFWGGEPGSFYSEYRPYNVKEGILQIPVMGVLINRMGFQLGRWATGYTYIEKAVKRGMDDAEVKGIAFIMDSPGGEAAGNFELVDKIFAYRGVKPMRAYSADRASSAAYSIASAADTISMSRSSTVGSIGVLSEHMSYAENLKKRGVEFTPMFAGARKVDGHPLLKLSPEAKARFEEKIESLYEEFTGTVSRNRGIDQADVIATQALTYGAQDAIAVGLADVTGSLEDEIALFAEELSTESGDQQMTDKKTNDETMVSKADHEAAVLAARVEGKAEGMSEATERQDAILNDESAKDRPKMAMRLVKTSMSAEDAIAFMKDSDPEVATPASAKGEQAADTESNETGLTDKKDENRDHFSEAMQTSGLPNIGADDKSDGTDKNKMSESDEILKDFTGATGGPAEFDTGS